MENIIGKKFGKLTVICDDPNNSDHVIVRCDCGNENQCGVGILQHLQDLPDHVDVNRKEVA